MKRESIKRLGMLGLLTVALLLALIPAVTVRADLINGGFETGTFDGWTVVNLLEDPGTWYVYTGTVSPLNAIAVPEPPLGTYAALTDGQGIGAYALYQDIVVPPQGGTLSFYVYYVSGAEIVAPATLDPVLGPNQQYRVDLLSPAQPDFSLDVLQNLFATDEGDPLTLDPTLITVNLTPYAGTTVRFRATAVDSLSFLNAGLDGVVFVPNPIEGGDERPAPVKPVVVVPVPGCDALITIPADAVGAKITADTLAMWKPGQTTNTLLTAGTSVRALGLDASGMYTKILFACDFLWVPRNTIGPNPESPWYGAPLPTGVVQ